MAGVLDNYRVEDDWGWQPCSGDEDVGLDSPNRTESIDCVAHHHGGGATATHAADELATNPG